MLLVNQIINNWEYAFNKLFKKISQKNISYKPRIAILPTPVLHKFKIFTQKDKIELIQLVDKISDLQNKLFISLRDKSKHTD